MRLALTYNEKRSAAEREAEFDTRATIDQLVAILTRLGHTVVPVDVSGSIPRLLARLARLAPDVVFDLAEGERGAFREAFYPALFEQLGLAYTGSSPAVRALCLDKALASRIVGAAGGAVAGGTLVRSPDELARDTRKSSTLTASPPSERLAMFVKPNFEGSSKGITLASVVESHDALVARVTELLARYPEGVLVEPYVDGLDVAVGWVAGLGWLPPIAYRYESAGRYAVYDYALKHEHPERVGAEIPARLEAGVLERLRAAAERAFAALGIAGYGRADFRVTPAGEVVFLELNPLPSLADGELFRAARVIDASPGDLLAGILNAVRMPVNARLASTG